MCVCSAVLIVYRSHEKGWGLHYDENVCMLAEHEHAAQCSSQNKKKISIYDWHFFFLYTFDVIHTFKIISCVSCVCKKQPSRETPSHTARSQPAPIARRLLFIFSVRTKRFKKRHVGIIVQSVSNVVNTFACKNSSSQPEQPIPHIVCRYLFK